MRVNVAIVNAFIDGETGGNPAGVVLDSDLLNDSQKLLVAKRVGLSETAFVSKSAVADFKLEFYTPQRQIAHCGHATIATFSYLSQQKLLNKKFTSKETIDGNRNITVVGNYAFMSQTKPIYSSVEEPAEVFFESIGIKSHQVLSRPIIVNTGNSFLVIGVRSKLDLETLKPQHEEILKISEKYGLIGYYVYTLDVNLKDRDASTRMFAPLYGIFEESATGMAAGPLACFLRDKMHINKETFLIEQGYSMHPVSPSCIEVTLDIQNNEVQGLQAGGLGKLMDTIQVEI